MIVGEVMKLNINHFDNMDKLECGTTLGWKGMSETNTQADLPIPYLQKEALGIPFRLPGNIFNTFFINLRIS